MKEELAILKKHYELTLGAIKLIVRFPKDHKFTLGDRIQNRLLDVLELLIEARYTKERLDLLRRVNLALEKTRYLLRMACDLEVLAPRSLEHLSALLQEVGAMTGGWMRAARRGAP